VVARVEAKPKPGAHRARNPGRIAPEPRDPFRRDCRTPAPYTGSPRLPNPGALHRFTAVTRKIPGYGLRPNPGYH